jgi:hypothetical protein
MKSLIRAAVVGAVFLFGSLHASANMIQISFYQLTNNNTEDLSSQLYATLWDADMANAQYGTSLGSDQILFTFHNDVGTTSNIAEIYFDDGLLGPSVALNSLGGFTNFTGGGANPGNLPGGMDALPEFNATQEFSADVNPGNPANGINEAGDILGVQLGLGSAGSGLYETWDQVAQGMADGDLRLGLHVRTIGALGGSDSYVSLPPDFDNGVPVPGTLFLFGLGLLGLATQRKKFS